MSLPASARPVIFLVVGLAVGGIGAAMFRDSLPGAKGSPEERINELETQLKSTENRLKAAEATARRNSSRHLTQGMLDLMGDFKAGRPVNPDDIYRAFQPIVGSLSPILDKIRVRQEKRAIDGKIGELARRYNLGPEQEEKLREWFDRKIRNDAARFSSVLARPGITLPEVAREMNSNRWDDGLDQFVKSSNILKGEDLVKFEDERMAEKAERVQQEADMRVNRIDGIVDLDAKQRDQMFAVMARNARDYDPRMEIDGATGDIGPIPGGGRESAMMEVLRPEQRQALEAEQQRRRDEAAKEFSEIGLSLPGNWDALEDY